MYNYKLKIEYDGTGFNGWQRQKNTKNTIQENIENALSKILKENIQITGAGRTDTGVSAYEQVANFRTDKNIEGKKILYSLNSVLPPAISVLEIKKVNADFNARYSAKQKEYIYKITLRKKGLKGNHFYKLNYNLDFGIIDRFINSVTGKHSFRSFCRNKEDKHDFHCDLKYVKYKIKRKNDEIIFSICADRFLHSMVRSLMGCIIETGRGKVELNSILNKFKKGEKIKTVYLPGKALFLNKIYY